MPHDANDDSRGARVAAGTGLGVQLRAVRKHFGEVAVVNTIDLTIEPGQFLSLIGPSGCGKTTILRMVGGLERCDGGSIAFHQPDGTSLRDAEARSRIAYCFQEPRLLPWRSVLRNIELPLELAAMASGERRDRAAEAMERLQLRDAHDRFPSQLSGGMKMRVSMARALVTGPRLLLLDEPFGALDEVTRQELDAMLRQLWESDRFTALLVTHSIPEAVALSTRAIVLSPRPARVEHETDITGVDHDDGDGLVRLSDAFTAQVRELSTALVRGMRGRSR